MKPIKLIVSLAAAICALSSAQAQTNTATFTATLTVEGPIIHTATSSSRANITSVLNTEGLIAELGHATTNSFSTTAKLEVITGPHTQFAVRDGANFVLIPTNIVSINPTTGNSVISGVETATSLREKQLMVFELDFNDVGTAGSDLQFTLRGIGSIAMVETATSTSSSARITLMGDGTKGGTNLVAIAILSGK